MMTEIVPSQVQGSKMSFLKDFHYFAKRIAPKLENL